MACSFYSGDQTGNLLATTNLDATSGQISFDWAPGIAWDTPGQTRQTLLDLGDHGGLDVQLIYYGDMGALGNYLEPYIILVVDNNQAGYLSPRHDADETLHLTLRWGPRTGADPLWPTPFTTISRRELGGGPWWKSDNWTSATLPGFTPAASIGIGTNIDGSDYGAGAVVGTISNVQVSSERDYERQVIIFGNSLTREPSGQTVPNARYCFGRRIAEIRPGWGWGISGVSETTEESLVRLQEDVIDQRPDLVLVSRGINEISTGVSAAVAQGYFVTLFAALAAADIPVIATTVCPFGNNALYTGAKETERQTLNTWLRTVPTNVRAVIDFDALVRDPAAQEDILAAYDFGDGVHLNDAAHAVLAAEVAEYIPADDAVTATSALVTSVAATSAHIPTITAVAS